MKTSKPSRYCKSVCVTIENTKDVSEIVPSQFCVGPLGYTNLA